MEIAKQEETLKAAKLLSNVLRSNKSFQLDEKLNAWKIYYISSVHFNFGASSKEVLLFLFPVKNVNNYVRDTFINNIDNNQLMYILPYENNSDPELIAERWLNNCLFYSSRYKIDPISLIKTYKLLAFE